jgi:hypothetical protein
LATLELGPAPGRDAELRAWLVGTALPAVYECPGITASHLCEAQIDVTKVKTEEKKLRDQPDALVRWVVLVEGVASTVVENACRDVMGVDHLTLHGATEPSLAVYSLVYCLAP